MVQAAVMRVRVKIESETRGWLDRVAKGGFHAKFSGGGDGAICVGREKSKMGQTRGFF